MLEAELLDGILRVARLYGWRSAHFRPARTAHGWRTPVGGDGKGWPDLFLVRPPRLLVVELKSGTGRVEPDQRRWLEDLAACGVEAHVWRPQDLEEAARILAR